MRLFLIVAGLCLAVPAGAQAPSPLQLWAQFFRDTFAKLKQACGRQ